MLPKRKSPRLKEYDYSLPGAYFVTICTQERENLFGLEPELTPTGKIVKEQIELLKTRYDEITIDKYVVMPNHIHIIITILETERINPFPTIKYDIPNVIGKFKAGVTRSVGNAFMHSAKKKIWQKSFHDRIIRNEDDYKKIWEYIDTNPLKWELDCFYNRE